MPRLPTAALIPALALAALAAAAVAQDAAQEEAPAAEVAPAQDDAAAEPQPAQAEAAGGAGPFGGFKHDSSAPIEVTSDALEVRQGEQIAIFSGDVVAGQGTLRLTADEVTVTYGGEGEQSGEIRTMVAEGNVFLSNQSETAEGQRAEYDVAEGMMRMWGDVVLTQGQNAISGESLVINLEAGTGRIEGAAGERVKSVFTPAGE